MRDFNHTVNVLVLAYLNNTLKHRDCKACAVGNIISEGATNYEFILNAENKSWFCALGLNTFQRDYKDHNHPEIIKTGYAPDELVRIERAFERAPKRIKGPDLFMISDTDDEWMFNGLMAVVDVLAEIHGIDLTQREEAKLLFVKA